MAYLDPKLRFDIPARLRRWLRDSEVPAERPSWQEAVYAEVGEFLFEHRLDPTPDNYDLAFQFRSAANAGLVAAIRAEIDRSGALSAEAAERIFGEASGLVGAEALADFARRIEVQASGLTTIARQSGRDASEYGAAIEAKSATGETDAILELTAAMVGRTRNAEAQLRQTQHELGALRSTLAEAQRVADVDPLTELPNRRAFKRELEAAIENARRARTPLSLAFCDIDHFKRVNDMHGHETGDRVLRYVAAALARHFEDEGLVGRFGGEEFVVMLPSALSAARSGVDACRAALAERRLYAATDGTALGSVTFSAGVTTLVDGDCAADLLRRADVALYRAKADGRDRVVIG